MLNTLRLKSSVLLGKNNFLLLTLLDKSFRVLQLPTHVISNLTAD